MRKQKDDTWSSSVLNPKTMKFNLKANRADETINLVIPLQDLVELQAKRSFAAGVSQALVFVGDAIKSGAKLDDELFGFQFAVWGLSDYWDKAKKNRTLEK